MSAFLVPALFILQLVPVYLGYKILKKQLDPHKRKWHFLWVSIIAAIVFFIYTSFCVWSFLRVKELIG
jgi:hypothetical protein